MSKPVKDLITKELAAAYAGVDSACVVDLTGLDAIATHKVRGALRSKGIALHVVKNRLARRAFADGPLAPLGSVLQGPCALAIGGESIVDVAKELVRLTKEHGAIALKMAIIEGEPDLANVAEVATWKSKAETQGEVVMLALSPGARISGCLRAPGGLIAGCLKAIIEKAEKGDDDAAAA